MANETTGKKQEQTTAGNASENAPGRRNARENRPGSARQGKPDGEQDGARNEPGGNSTDERQSAQGKPDKNPRDNRRNDAQADAPRTGRSHRSSRSGKPTDGGRDSAKNRHSAENERLSDNGRRASENSRPTARNGRKSSDTHRDPRAASVGLKGGRWTWREYALQLSVVVIGIVVTFAGSGLIERWSRQRQLKMTMQLIVDELTTNRNALSEVCGQLEYDRRGMLMFTAYDRLEDIPADSLSHYGLILSILPSYRPQQEALEVLRSSDMISTVGDKKFLAEIFGCYNRLTDFRENVGKYAGRKQDAQNHLFMNSPDFSLDPMGSLGSWKTIMADPMCAAFIGTSAYFFGGSEYFRRTLQEVDAVVAAIREKYGVE